MHLITESLEARDLINSGLLCLYPTETFYALGSSIFSENIKTIFAIKKRPITKALPCIAHSTKQIKEFSTISPIHTDLFTLFPSISIILPLQRIVPYFQHSIIFRLPTTPLLHSLTENTPIISTSANISGNPPVADYNNLDPILLENVDGIILPTIIDDIPRGDLPSTIVCIKDTTIHILREGTISRKSLIEHSFTVF